jgi:glycosyltransferase involved in cell wall biosynthesis
MKSINPPLVSIIIPTFNRAWSIHRAIDSVLDQNYKNFELIVVDDGSTDATPTILSGYREAIKRINQRNSGVSAARNRGIAEASGRLITFLDSDDYWLPQKLSTQVDFFASHPDAVICQTEEIWIKNSRRMNPKKRHQKPSGMMFSQSLHLCLISPSAVMIRKELFDEAGVFDETLPACEDYDLWLRVTCRYPVHLIDTPLIVKTGGHPDQLSASPSLDKYRITAILKILKSGLLTESQHKDAVTSLKQKCKIYADGCRKRGRMDEASYYERLLMEISPYRGDKFDETQTPFSG